MEIGIKNLRFASIKGNLWRILLAWQMNDQFTCAICVGIYNFNRILMQERRIWTLDPETVMKCVQTTAEHCSFFNCLNQVLLFFALKTHRVWTSTASWFDTQWFYWYDAKKNALIEKNCYWNNPNGSESLVHLCTCFFNRTIHSILTHWLNDFFPH